MNKLIHLLQGLAVKERYKSNHRNPFVWVFGEWFGEKCSDNSFYLANYIAMRHPEIKVYWASKEHTDISLLHKRINHIIFGTKQALSVYKVAGAIFMNQGLRDFSESGLDYFYGALKVNLWHGVMWKRIGHDGSKKNNLFFSLYRKISDYTFGSNYYLALSEEYAKVCKSAFGARDQAIIRNGYPRNSIFYSKSELHKAKLQVIDVLRKQTKHEWPYNTKIITYMPTFRDKVSKVFSCEEFESNKEFLQWLGDNNIVLLQKAHFITRQRNKNLLEQKKAKRIFQVDDIPSQTLLAATDLLITDYSSCFFDFLLLDRPIIHFLYDYDYYKNKDRGLYYDSENVVCGDIAGDKNQLVKLIMQNISNPTKRHALRESRKEKYMTYETSNSCENICSEVFNLLNVRN
ncbi:CDP-glycerol glycerophosphotransferase family protein [Acidaminococcus fermentans]|uniref:CDP-glycerol glycerophosphotransferase family protein n=1 Tax=Acidaminococcus fermentans TaxID=905 RepID=UPI002E79BFC2|nr:CDP-glycerol glycerophosphotransferase family protein [Acidaminococcus fermentans]MEE1598209.1 CDP-glycerol glycerophosphotransferase family protein [Acidaminococcus fermentans]MEE4122471.1 CDP-glycerol glycerophosphotransferase family protein [Acidaminococcus fermentans]